MDKKILIRYGEIHLKGKNRGFFENMLIRNIKNNLSAYTFDFERSAARYVISNYDENCENEIIDILTKTFGIHSISVAYCCESSMENISKIAISLAEPTGSFRINTNRADKTFAYQSIEVSKMIGGIVLDNYPDLKVDLFEPDFTINIDIRENGRTYVYSSVIPCLDGMPVGCAGKGLAMLSGGIDSPVACYSMAKRGLKLELLHFHSYPYTSEMAKEKVCELAKILMPYTSTSRLICVPLTKIQEAIHEKCDSSYMITLVRIFMMQIAEQVALKFNCGCVINGESLGQVASQTLESINITNAQVKQLPIFRPLIGMNKEEIIDISKHISTYETSIQPYEDCCTVFLPDSPVTRPTLKRAYRELNKIEDAEALLTEAIDNLEIIEII